MLVSHWYVDDTATSDLVTATVQNAATGMNKAHALRKAMLAMMHRTDRDFAHPFFWAPFVFVGEGAANEEFSVALRSFEAVVVPGEGLRSPTASEAIRLRENSGVFGMLDQLSPEPAWR